MTAIINAVRATATIRTESGIMKRYSEHLQPVMINSVNRQVSQALLMKAKRKAPLAEISTPSRPQQQFESNPGT